MSVQTPGRRVPKNRRPRQSQAEWRGELLRDCLRELDFLQSMQDAFPASDPLCLEINRLMDERPDVGEMSLPVLRAWGFWFQAVLERARRRVC